MTTGESEMRRAIHPGLKLALEMGPLAVFFIGTSFFDFFVATAAFMVSLFLSMGISFVVTRHMPIMSIVSAVIVAVFGGLTLYLHDETFFRMKPTIIYALFGGALIGGLLFGKLLSLRWALFFFVLAGMNEIVRLFFPEYWIKFKVFGATLLTLGFAMAQAPLMMRYEQKDDANDEGAEPT